MDPWECGYIFMLLFILQESIEILPKPLHTFKILQNITTDIGSTFYEFRIIYEYISSSSNQLRIIPNRGKKTFALNLNKFSVNFIKSTGKHKITLKFKMNLKFYMAKIKILYEKQKEKKTTI